MNPKPVCVGSPTPVLWWFMNQDGCILPVWVRTLRVGLGIGWIAESAGKEEDFPRMDLPVPLNAGDRVRLGVDPVRHGCFLEPATPSFNARMFGRIRLFPLAEPPLAAALPPSGLPRFPTKTVPG